MEYGEDVLARSRRRSVPEIPAERGLVVENARRDFCGSVVRVDKDAVELEDRAGRRRVFPLRPGGFVHEGRPVTLVPVRKESPPAERRSASGSVRVANTPARQARASRVWVEGVHDAELIERVWGHDLRVEGVVVEPLHGLDGLDAALRDFAPNSDRRVGILVDHLVAGSKEARLVERVDDPHVLVAGHPFVDIWSAVRPEAVGITEWPDVPRGQDWKEGVCARLGWSGPEAGWRHVLAAVSTYRDLCTPLINAVEQLIDFTAESSDGD